MESFANRVDKVFGALHVTSCSWRLIPEKQRLAKTEQQLAEETLEEEEEEDIASCRPCGSREFSLEGMDIERDIEEEGRSVRRMIGLDATLDYEDEEDEFDKAAFGLDGSEEDRLYMKGINDSDRTLISSKSLPLSLHELKKSQRDPRANHSAARARLEEDAKVAAETSINMANMQMTDNWKATEEDVGVGDMKENFIGVKRSSEDTEAASEASATSDDKARIKPIKRVRFALDVQEQGSEVHSDNEFIRPKPISTFKSQVPDYILNPSKYTHYTLDWSVEDNDNSNVEAFKSCSETLQKTQEEFCSSEEVFGKIQFVHKHEKTSSNIQKDSMEDADRTSIAISRTMCVEHVDTENEDGEDLNNDEAIEIEAKSSTSIMNMFMERSVTRTVKNFRSKRESDVEEGT